MDVLLELGFHVSLVSLFANTLLSLAARVLLLVLVSEIIAKVFNTDCSAGQEKLLNIH